MVAGDQRDRLDLLGLEPAEVAVLHEVVRVLVVSLVADEHANVVQDGRVLEPLALAIGEAVNRARLVEQADGETRDVLRVIGPVLAAVGELEHAPPPHVGVAVGLRDLFAMARDVVEHEPFAQRQVAERDFFGAEPSQELVEEDGAGDREVGAPRLEAGDAQPFLEIEGDRPLSARGGSTSPGCGGCAASALGACPSRSRRDRPEAEDRARRADHALEAAVRDLVEVLPDVGVDVAHQAALIARFERIGLDEPLGQADDAKLEAPAQLDRGSVPLRDLDAAAADVDDDDRIPRDADAVDGRQMDESGFFGSGNDARPDAGLLR